jgi:3-deoxy-7-phosphoheptulonate synthase
MMESHLVEGNQLLGDDVQSLTYGQSITDACIGWEDTVEMLEELAEAVAARRARRA